VPHLHWHVWPVTSPKQFSFRTADNDPDPAMMDDAAARLRARLRARGHADHVPAEG
jgi:diadenosine tetraphosphate (Ap4A) HIT family hydrolase